MVHNGIEYGDMQLISEVYDVLKVSSQRLIAVSELFLIAADVMFANET